MRVSNILVTANYKITGEIYGDAQTTDYDEITKLCCDSFEDNLLGLNEIIIFKGEKKTYHEIFKDIFWQIKDLYSSELCNILWVDSDTVCRKYTRIFGKFHNFMMFSSANRFCNYPANVPVSLYRYLTPWMMSNIRYYPHGMKKDIWDAGENLAQGWINVWAYECIIYNTMFHLQGLDEASYMLPHLNCQYEPSQPIDVPLENANIVHVQATRGAKDAIKRMKEVLS